MTQFYENIMWKYAGIIFYRIDNKIVACENNKNICCCSNCDYEECPIRE